MMGTSTPHPGNTVLVWQMLTLAITISFDKNNKIQTSIMVEKQQALMYRVPSAKSSYVSEAGFLFTAEGFT